MTRPGDAARRARLGRRAVYPFRDEEPFGRALLGGTPRQATLDRLVVAPPLFTPLRLKKMTELGREPLYADVDTATELGGFETTLPLTVAAMGSTDVANRHGPAVAEGAARQGLVLGLGENIATLRGYRERRDPDQPCLMDRAGAYLDALPEDGPGGLVFQQSVEDAEDELWNRLYSDPDVAPHLEEGRIAFEVKAGQGAKPGLGGAVRMAPDEAGGLAGTYHFDEDPRTTDRDQVERHSAPGTYTEEILGNMLRLMRNNYPRARIWLKVAPYRDLVGVVEVAAEAGVDCITVDGAEAGTAMAPTATLEDSGLPTLACLARLRQGGVLDREGPTVLVSGGIRTGPDVLKCRALGVDGCAAGRAFVEAAREDGADGVARLIASLRTEVAMLTSSLGKYDVDALDPQDVAALDRDVAEALDVPWTMQAA